MPKTIERKIPPNPKYASIRSAIDTGATARKTPKIQSDQQISKRRGELFKRVNNAKIADLIHTVESEEGRESIYDLLDFVNEKDVVSSADCHSQAAPSVKSLGGGSVGVLSVVNSTCQGISENRDLLLVDLRDYDEYRKSRISLSINHPGVLIARDVIHPSLNTFKRKNAGKSLVVYHHDERQTTHYATLLVEKGWEDVYIVDGGFIEFSSSYPELIEVERTENVTNNSLSQTVLHKIK
jgi:centrosomal protein CEP41